MNPLEELYREIILQHYKKPLNLGRLEPPAQSTPGINPSCGDQLELFLQIEDGVIHQVRWQGQGCAISTASASMMTEAIKGKTPAQALALMNHFKAMIIDGVAPVAELGDLKALAGVHKLHARVKCATLAWHTLEEALKNA